MANRDDFSASVKRAVADRVNWNCCKPDCGAPTRGPHTLSDKSVNIGVAAHITAAAPGGPRYDASLTPEQRASFQNALWLCKSCSDLIDKDEVAFPVSLLKDWKNQAEARASLQIGKPRLHVETQLQQLVENNARLTETVAHLTLHIPIAPSTPNLQEQRLATDVDRALKWSESGDKSKIASARVIIGEVRDDAEFEQLSLEMRSRVATVAAMCAFITGDAQTAEKEVEAALKLNPGNAVCLSNAASVALLNDDFARAATLATQAHDLAPDNDNAILVLVQAWHSLGEREKVEEFLLDNPSFFELSHALSVLAHLRRREGRFDEAIGLAKQALRRDRKNVQALEELFDALFFPARGKSWLESGWEFGPQTRRQLQRAEAALSRAVTVLEAEPNQRKLHQTLSNRASVRSARGRIREALADCDRVLHSDPTPENRDTISLNKALILNRAGRAVEAIPLLESLQDARRREEGAFVLACSYHVAGQSEKALPIWERIWQPQKGNLAEMVTAELLLFEYRRRGDDAAAESVLQRVKDTFPDSAEFAALSAQDAFERRDFQSAVSLLREAIQICQQRDDQPSRVRLLLRLGDHCYRSNHFQEAASAWSEVGWSRLLPPYRSVFLNALYHCGQLDEALRVARQIKAEAGFEARAQEIEAAICAYTGDTQEACDLWKELSEREPHNPLHAINRAQAALQGQDETTARQALQAVSYQSIENDAHSLRRVSSMQSRLGFQDAIRFAFRARQLDFGNPQSHNNYVQVFLDSTNAHSFDEEGTNSKTRAADVLGLNSPARGKVPCTIRLQPTDSQNKEEQRSITILEEGPFDHTHDIYGARDEFARRLLDYSRAREGTFSIYQGPGLPAREYLIAEVLSPYVHAFQESPSKSVEWFGEGATMWSMNIEEGFDPLFAWMDERGQVFEELMRQYEEWRFPLCCVASHFNRSMFDLWFLVSRLPKWGIHAELGATPAFEAGIERLQAHFISPQKDGDGHVTSAPHDPPPEKPILVLDSTALLALVHLDLGEVIAPHFRLLVPVSLRRRLENEDKQGQLPHLPPDVFARLLTWVDSHTQVLPVTSLLSFPPSDIHKWQEVLGHEELDVLLLAREHSALLLCDDALFRQIGEWETQIQVSGVNTQQVLLFLRRNELLSEAAHFTYLETMATHNVRHLLLPTNFFQWLLEKHNCQTNEFTRAAFRFLEAPMCRAEGAVAIVAFALAEVALSSPTNLEKALDLCLLPLMTGHPIKETLTLLQFALANTRLGKTENRRMLQTLVVAINKCKRQALRGLGNRA